MTESSAIEKLREWMNYLVSTGEAMDEDLTEARAWAEEVERELGDLESARKTAVTMAMAAGTELVDLQSKLRTTEAERDEARQLEANIQRQVKLITTLRQQLAEVEKRFDKVFSEFVGREARIMQLEKRNKILQQRLDGDYVFEKLVSGTKGSEPTTEEGE